MYKKNILLLASCYLWTAVSFAQNPQANMEAFVKKINASPVMEMNFTAHFENLQDESVEEYIGTVLSSGDKYRIIMGDINVYCDGKSKWLYSKSADEVTIFPAGETADIMDNPILFITANYKNGFRYKQNAARTENGKALEEIEMYPVDRNSNYTAVILTYEAKTLQPYAVKYNTKDGLHYTIKITRFNTEVKVEDANFTFPTAQYPNAEVIDLR